MPKQYHPPPPRRAALMGSNQMGYTPVGAPFAAAKLANAVQNANNLATAVKRINQQNRKDNTTAAYDPKVSEFYEYCEHRFAGLHVSSRFTVNAAKCYEFLFYHAMRNKYKQGGKRRSEGSAHGFDKKDFDDVYHRYGRLCNSAEGASDDVADPTDPCGFDLVNTYKSVVFNIWMTQVASQSNSQSWDMIFTMPCKELMTMVKNRRQRIKRKTYKEKIDADFAPFTSLSQITCIERALWHNGATTMKGALPGLRNRFAFLACYSGILRSESVFLGELSDMFGIEHKRQRDPHPYFISIMQIATGEFLFLFLLLLFVYCITIFTLTNRSRSLAGKTVTTKKQYGRSMRHKDVRECSIGAFGLYLLFRFAVSGEMDDGHRPDFAINKEWFDIKILSDGSLDNTKRMNSRSYTDPLRKVFDSLGIIASHFGHFGRVVGPVKLEFEEVSSELIRILGKCRCVCRCVFY
jgi:hypothetical protein